MSNASTLDHLVDQTSDAYMALTYGRERLSQNITDLAEANYTAETIMWIVRSKIARWANDENISMLEYVTKLGDVKLRTWMRETE